MKFIPNVVTRQVARQILVTQKHSPRILFVAGVGGIIVSSVLACKATLNLSETLDDVETTIKGVQEDMKETKHYRSDLAYAYVTGIYKIGKLYGPAVIVGTASIAALTTSHVTLTRRNAGLTAAYALVTKSFDEYRDRVKAEVGEERERDIHHAISISEIPDKSGKGLTKVQSADPNRWSPYAKFFDEASVNWQKNAEMNRIFIQAQQNYANHILQARGHVFLNEVYDMLGLDRTSAGQVVGWVISDNGDNFIDFGMFEAHNSRFVNGWERNIILDFNVDGVIYDKI